MKGMEFVRSPERPIFICGQGPSINGLVDYIDVINATFPTALWAGMNDYKKIEPVIKRQFDYLFFSDPHLVHLYAGMVREFLDRPMCNHFISDFDTMQDLCKFGGWTRIANEHGSVIYSSQSRGRNEAVAKRFYNSLMAMMLTLIGLGHRTFFLCGFDGGGDPNQELYFGVPPGEDKDEVPAGELSRRLNEDSEFINTNFQALKDFITEDKVTIINFCPDSRITAFPRYSYEEYFHGA